MFIIATGGNALFVLSLSLSLLSNALVLINGSILRSPQWFFAVLFAPHRVLRRVIRKREGGGNMGIGKDRRVRRQRARWNTYRDNYVTFCFATTRDFFLASVPASWRTRLVLPRNLRSSRLASDEGHAAR